MTQKVRLYPLPGVFVDGIPHEVQDVSPAEAERLQAFTPAAFTTTPPDKKAAAADGDKPPKPQE